MNKRALLPATYNYYNIKEFHNYLHFGSKIPTVVISTTHKAPRMPVTIFHTVVFGPEKKNSDNEGVSNFQVGIEDPVCIHFRI